MPSDCAVSFSCNGAQVYRSPTSCQTSTGQVTATGLTPVEVNVPVLHERICGPRAPPCNPVPPSPLSPLGVNGHHLGSFSRWKAGGEGPETGQTWEKGFARALHVGLRSQYSPRPGPPSVGRTGVRGGGCPSPRPPHAPPALFPAGPPRQADQTGEPWPKDMVVAV